MSLFTKKSIDSLLREQADPKNGLKRLLSPRDLTTMGVGAIIGAGLFVLTGQAAAHYAGPAVILSFAIAATICIFSALCYAELASLIPGAGSAYVYSYVVLGEFAAWTIGWCLTFEYLLSSSTVASGWSAYFVSLLKDLGLQIPSFLSQPPVGYHIETGWNQTGSFCNLPAMIITALIGIFTSIGVRTAAFLNNLLVIIKLAVILIFILCGIAYVNVDNWAPFIPENSATFGQFGWSGVLRGAGIVFFAFIGFDALSTLAQEARNPQKDMPKGMLGSLGISTLVYAIVALILTGVVHYTKLGVPDPMAVAFDALGPSFAWLRPIVKIAILAGLTSVILVMLMGQARIFYAMSQDGLLPAVFGKTHARFHTPFFTTIAVSIIAVLMTGFFPVEILGQLVSMGTLLGFAAVCLSVLILHYTKPELERPFKTPFSPWVPLLGVLSCLAQMTLLPWMIWLQLLAWIGIGSLFYVFYSRHHSKAREEKKSFELKTQVNRLS
ncbi:MAG: APC family permease [Anaerolineae bacterium]